MCAEASGCWEERRATGEEVQTRAGGGRSTGQQDRLEGKGSQGVGSVLRTGRGREGAHGHVSAGLALRGRRR